MNRMMKKMLSMILASLLAVSMLSGCEAHSSVMLPES